MAARHARDRHGRTPRQYVVDRLAAALAEAPVDLGPEGELRVLNSALNYMVGDTCLARGLADALRSLLRRKPRARSFSTHLAEYLLELTPEARTRLFGDARRKVGEHSAADAV